MRIVSATVLVVAIVLVAASGDAQLYDISSYAVVEADGTLSVRGYTIHLFGIFFPPTRRTCGTFERPPECGPLAVLALDSKIGPHFVDCKPRWKNRDGSLTAVCRVRGEDLAAYLLSRGLALALPDAPFEYQALEEIARSRQLGVWGPPFD